MIALPFPQLARDDFVVVTAPKAARINAEMAALAGRVAELEREHPADIDVIKVPKAD